MGEMRTSGARETVEFRGARRMDTAPEMGTRLILDQMRNPTKAYFTRQLVGLQHYFRMVICESITLRGREEKPREPFRPRRKDSRESERD